jgi:UDP-4-keto-D-QuiNAc 4-reductase
VPAPETILVTGANGFLGRALLQKAGTSGRTVRALVRRPTGSAAAVRCEVIVETDPFSRAALTRALRGVNAVVHSAGRAHVMHESPEAASSAFQRVNTEATLSLARAAAEAGVRRFVFVSTIKVNGERTRRDARFLETDQVDPSDPYSRSKWDAERGLTDLATQTGLEVTVVRPPLVYGPGVRANFLSLMHWVDRGFPLPFAAIDNRRSLISVDNLADLLLCCATHARAAGELFLASDGYAPSIADLARAIALLMGRRPRLLPVPRAALTRVGSLLGRGEQVRRLCDSLWVDGGKARRLLGWTPPESPPAALQRTVDWFRDGRAHS